MPRLLKAAAEETLRATTAIEAILLYGSRATGTHREDSDWDIAVVTRLTRDEGFKAAGALYTDEVAEQHWTEVVCTTRRKIERYANTAGTLESRIAREAVLIAGEWKRPACTEGHEPFRTPQTDGHWWRIDTGAGFWADGRMTLLRIDPVPLELVTVPVRECLGSTGTPAAK